MPTRRKTPKTAGETRRTVRVRRCGRWSAFRCLIAAASLLFSTAAFAHDTWLLPERAWVPAGGTAILDLTSGMQFPKSEVPVKPDRLEKASLRLRGKEEAISNRSLDKNALRLRVPLAEEGIAALSAESKPRTLELKPKEVREYLDEIGAWESVGKKWEAEGSGRWVETYTKHSKTFVRVGEPAGDSSWLEPTGMKLEIVPESDPTALASGGEIAVRLLRNGKPLARFPLGFVAAGQKAGAFRQTDEEGRAKIPLDRTGWWLLRATKLTPTGKGEWESHFTTLTVFVGK